MFKRVWAALKPPVLTPEIERQVSDLIRLIGAEGEVYDESDLLAGKSDALYWALRLKYVQPGSAWTPTFTLTAKGRKLVG